MLDNEFRDSYGLRQKAEQIIEIGINNLKDKLENGLLQDYLTTLYQYSDAERHHSMNVASITLMLCLTYDFTETELEQIAIGCLLHDAGKLRLEPLLLYKPHLFTPEERKLVEQHSVNGKTLLEKATENEIILNIAHLHHERLDGKGYPLGLKGDEIPLYVQIVSIADVFDALVSKRCYKDSLSAFQAIEKMESFEGLNKEVLNKLKSIISTALVS